LNLPIRLFDFSCLIAPLKEICFLVDDQRCECGDPSPLIGKRPNKKALKYAFVCYDFLISSISNHNWALKVYFIVATTFAEFENKAITLCWA